MFCRFRSLLSIYAFILSQIILKLRIKLFKWMEKLRIKKGRLGVNLNVFLFFGRKHFCNSQLFSRIDNGGWKTLLSMNRI